MLGPPVCPDGRTGVIGFDLGAFPPAMVIIQGYSEYLTDFPGIGKEAIPYPALHRGGSHLLKFRDLRSG